MGRVTVSLRLENMADLLLAERGIIPPEQIHSLEVPDALVDTGATYLCMPLGNIQQLGFDRPLATRQSQTAAGVRTVGIYGPAKLTIQGRFCSVDIAEVADGCPVLIGQVPLELLDFVVDPQKRELTGNPRHGGQPMIEVFRMG